MCMTKLQESLVATVVMLKGLEDEKEMEARKEKADSEGNIFINYLPALSEWVEGCMAWPKVHSPISS